jgi:flagellar motility protein MotE (MotC chaperone)
VADTEIEKNTYGAFERFLYLFMIPLIFTSILIGVLFALFDYDVKNSFLKAAHKIPVIRDAVPAPKDEKTVSEPTGASGSEGKDAAALRQQFADQLSQKEKEIGRLTAEAQQKNQIITELETRVDALQEQLNDKLINNEQYRQNIRTLADMYAGMTASKSAPILENLTLNERVLILSEMNNDSRRRILEKMNPQMAAETSILLKDRDKTKDLQIAALQERIDIYLKMGVVDESISTEDLALTFAGMDAKSASSVLLEMSITNQNKVINILRAMTTQARSAVMAAMAKENKEKTAEISTKLTE